MILFLVACGGPPDGIPDSPGTIDEVILPELLTAASPDLPYMLLQTARQVTSETYRECPQVDVSGTSTSVRTGPDGCVDSSNIVWNGSVSVERTTEGEETITYNHLRATDGLMYGPWEADGTLIYTPFPAGGGSAEGGTIVTRVELLSLIEPELQVWVDTKGSLTEWSGIPYVDKYTGTIGVGAWGTAEIDGSRVTIAHGSDPMYCGYGNHGAGTMSISGTNLAEIHFLQEFDTVDDGSARAPADTGAADTGPETGADTSPVDTSPVDTSPVDTSPVDTSPVDTGPVDTGTGPLPGEDQNQQYCGTCIAAVIGGELIPSCFELSHILSYPFYEPFVLPPEGG